MVNNLSLPSCSLSQAVVLGCQNSPSLKPFLVLLKGLLPDPHAAWCVPPSHSGTHCGLCLGVTFPDHPIENNASFRCHWLSLCFDFYSFNELMIT